MSNSSREVWQDFLGFTRQEIAPAGPVPLVVTRDGETRPFDPERVKATLRKTFTAVRGAVDEDLVTHLTNQVLHGLSGTPDIEAIQDRIEVALIEGNHADLAKAFILYRERHAALRDSKKLMLDIGETMEGYLSGADWRVKENANVNYSLGGLILHNSGTLTANYWLRNVYPEAIAEAHQNADFHLHDLSMFSGYCAGWSLRQLIVEGLGGVNDKICSSPAKHLSTLVNQMVNFLGVMQNEWAGAQALSSFDTYLAPFVREDHLSYDDVLQAVQSFIYGVNTPSRWGSQAPFTNITLDWTVPSDLKDRQAVVGGKDLDYTYGDCQAEMDLVNKAFLEVMITGDAQGRGFAYPIPTYNITRDFAWDSPNAQLLFDMTAKYGTPYFQNFLNSDLDPSDVRSMCCRLQLDKRELRKRGGGLFGSDEFTGSIGVVTINLPRIGYLASRGGKPDKLDFYNRLDHLMDLAAQSLTIKRKVISRLTDAGLFPYTKRYLKHYDNHFSTIGLSGIHETCQNFLGREHGIETPEGKQFAEEILVHMRERLQDYQERYGDLFNLEATPAESTSYRLALHDRKHHPDIITSGLAQPFYTNSSQLPVDFTADIFDALDHQESLQTKYTGGTVFHGFLGERISDWKACRSLVKAMCSNYRIPYFTISPTFSICPVHGYLAGEHFSCPQCEAEEKHAIETELVTLRSQL
ncbi:MAG: ribonucleoside triphosphate reductase [Spirochaetales bacterium]